MKRAWGSAMTVVVVLLAAPLAAVGQQGSNFNRLNTLRREVTVSPSPAGQNQVGDAQAGTPTRGQFGTDPLRPYTAGTPSSAGSSSSSLGSQSRRKSQPMSVQTRTTPHTFYPGMRAAQGPNRNVPSPSTRSRTPVLIPGLMGAGAGMMGQSSAPARSRSQRLAEDQSAS